MYGSSRFAIYETIKSEYKNVRAAEPTIYILLAAAAVSGFIGGVIGNAADVANVRMQNDSALPPAMRRSYTSVIDAFIRIGREDGFHGYSRGVWVNASRAAIMTSCQLGSYDGFKNILTRQLGLKDNTATHFSASALAALVATTLCSPVDVIKTQIMSSTHTRPVLETVRGIYRAEGPRCLLRGWVPSFTRVGPQTVVTFVLLEQHKKLYRRYKGIE
ncbi:Mitochondrial dicarboxylate transporter [Hypocenomyce scalaris]|nr:Mitochondrial dicarboxylate transporter [Hypocenomyce scalaris]